MDMFGGMNIYVKSCLNIGMSRASQRYSWGLGQRVNTCVNVKICQMSPVFTLKYFESMCR